MLNGYRRSHTVRLILRLRPMVGRKRTFSDSIEELITKPARPKRRNAQRANTERPTDSAEPVSSSQRVCTPLVADLATIRVSTPTPSSTFTSSAYASEQSVGFRTVNYNPPPRSPHERQEKLVPQAVISIERERGQPAWYRTVMN